MTINLFLLIALIAVSIYAIAISFKKPSRIKCNFNPDTPRTIDGFGISEKRNREFRKRLDSLKRDPKFGELVSIAADEAKTPEEIAYFMMQLGTIHERTMRDKIESANKFGGDSNYIPH